MTLWVVTGPTGAGTEAAVRALERSGVECVDNLPPELVADFLEVSRDRGAAAVVDARQGWRLERFVPPRGAAVLFLDAHDDVLLRRAMESTRPHPCAAAGSGQAAVRAERALLQPLRAAADVVIDTSELSATQVGERVRELVVPGRDAGTLHLTVSSFGYKFGPQGEADWVLDARMLRNPFWVDELRPLTGLDPLVRDYVLADPAAHALLRRAVDLFGWAAPKYLEHGRRFLHVAIGCTGGRHRSVVVVQALAEQLTREQVAVSLRHRDAGKPDPRDTP